MPSRPTRNPCANQVIRRLLKDIPSQEQAHAEELNVRRAEWRPVFTRPLTLKGASHELGPH